MAKQQLPSEMKILAGLRLRAARLVLGVDAEKDMAEQLGVTTNAYSNYETGTRLVDVAMSVRLLELTGIGPDWIYAGATTGVPFDRARSLQSHLRRLQDGENAIRPRRKGRKPPDPFAGGNAKENNLDDGCAATNVRILKVPA